MMAAVRAAPVIADVPEFTDELMALADKVGLGKEMRAHLVANDFLDPLDIKLLGSTDTEVITNVQNSLPSDNSVPWDLTAQKNIKKLWTFAKNAAPEVSSHQSVAAPARAPDDEEALPEGIPEAIEKAWAQRHSFHLSGARLLIGGDYNRVYNCLMKKKPKELPKMNPEKFRLANEGITGESKGLFLGEDGTVATHKKFFAEIVAHDMFWWKIRAFLSTICYLTVQTPDFFPFQACEIFSDALHDVILAPHGSNQRLSLGQCKTAWMTMISALHVKMFQTGCTLASLTENDMVWKSHWAWHGGSSSQSGGGGGGSSQATPRERQLQSELDRARSQLKGKGKGTRIRRGSGGNNSGGKINNGGGAQKRSNSNFNSDVPPPPQGGTGKTAGAKAWAKRTKKGGGK